MGSSDLPIAHFSGAAIAALLNFPLWRYATMAQAKYEVAGVGRATWGALLGPPYRGVAGIVGGMTVARGGIFLLSDVGTKALRRRGVEGPAAVPRTGSSWARGVERGGAAVLRREMRPRVERERSGDAPRLRWRGCVRV